MGTLNLIPLHFYIFITLKIKISNINLKHQLILEMTVCVYMFGIYIGIHQIGLKKRLQHYSDLNLNYYTLSINCCWMKEHMLYLLLLLLASLYLLLKVPFILSPPESGDSSEQCALVIKSRQKKMFCKCCKSFLLELVG